MQPKPGMICISDDVGMIAFSEINLKSANPFLGRYHDFIPGGRIITIISVVALKDRADGLGAIFIYDHHEGVLRWSWATPFLAKLLVTPC